MRAKALISLVLAGLLGPAVLVAQQGAGGGGQRQRPQSGVGQRQGSGTMDRTRSRTYDQTGDRTRQMQRDRLHTQATTQQRDQYRTCDQTLSQTRTHARDMARAAKGNVLSTVEMRQHHEELQQQLRTMRQDRERLYNGLSAEQQNAVRERNQNLEQLHAQVQNRLEEMNQEMNKQTPNVKRVAQQARATERAMNTYQKEFRAMGDELGLKND